MTDLLDEESAPFVFNEILPIEKAFPSLLSICKDIPMNIKITFSQNTFSIKNRLIYKNNVEKRINRYRQKNSRFLQIFESEFKSLCNWIKKEQHTRTYMKILLNKWLQKKYKDRLLNTDDPCTLMPPIKLIKVFDTVSRGVYQFEASSLKKQFETALQYSEWMFPKPSHPKNPLTNIAFNEGQRLLIIESLYKYSYSSWAIEAYKKARWNLIHFAADNAPSLKINSITQLCKEPTAETQELLDEFIINQYEENEIGMPYVKTALRWAVINKIDDEYMKSWLKLMRDYYVIKYRYNIISDDSDNVKLNIIYINSIKLFDNLDVIEVFRQELQRAIQNPPEPIDSEDSDSNSEDSIPPLGNIVYFETFDVNIEELINNLIEEAEQIIDDNDL